MLRGLLLVGLVLTTPRVVGAARPEYRCLDDRAALAPSGPWHVTLSGGAGAGVFFATHLRTGLSVGRRFLDRVELELSVNFDAGAHLLGHEEALRLGILLQLSRRWSVLQGWRVGHAWFSSEVPLDRVQVSSLVVSLTGELRCALSRTLELRLAPLVFTGYWNGLWGFCLEPGAGLAFRF